MHFDKGYFTHAKILDPFVCESSAKNKKKKNKLVNICDAGRSFPPFLRHFIYLFIHSFIGDPFHRGAVAAEWFIFIFLDVIPNILWF